MDLAPVELEKRLLPTAVFYDAEDKTTHGGPAAIAADVSGSDGRLMRSLKSVLGSGLMDKETDIGGGKSRAYADVLADFLRHLKCSAEAHSQSSIDRAVIGRPVFFVDDDPVRDAQAQATLQAVAHRVGFREVSFQLEPMAAAGDLEQSLDREALTLIADFGGGTCDFSIVRLAPNRAASAHERRSDVLAHHGIHVAGTDFDRRVSLQAIMPMLGAGSLTPKGREVPSAVYHDLATWHLINTVYSPARVRELSAMRELYRQPHFHARLMFAVRKRLGHQLAALAEQGKVDAADHGQARVDLSELEAGLVSQLSHANFATALDADLRRVVDASLECARRAGLVPSAIELIYFTGGSSRLGLLTDRIRQAFSQAKPQFGDSFASVAKGLGVQALRLM